MKRILLFLFVCLPLGIRAAQQDSIRELLRRNPELRGGSSTLYRYTPQRYTPAPQGFEAFHIEHIGRHGSRTHASPTLDKQLRDQLAAADSAGLLTPKGKRLLTDLKTLCDRMYRRYGDLTRHGREQHRQIARRMYANFPEVLGAEGSVSAVSTFVPRCAESMASFVEALKGCNPALQITPETSRAFDTFLRFNQGDEYQQYLHGPVWRKEYDAYAASLLDPARLLKTLLKNGSTATIPDPRAFMIGLYSLAAIMPNTDFGLSFYDYFTEEEQFALWRIANLREYLLKMNSATSCGLSIDMAKPLVRQMLDSTQEAVDGGEVCAVLRFGHGEDTMPLAVILGIEGLEVCEPDPAKVYLAWQDFDTNPMAANIQWILYRNAAGRVLIKVLLNEREVALPLPPVAGPYYDWEDFRTCYGEKISRMPDMTPLPEVKTGF